MSFATDVKNEINISIVENNSIEEGKMKAELEEATNNG